MAARIYPAISGRQQDADRLVYDEGDLRRTLAEAARTRSVATIRLASDIFLTRPISLQGVSYALVVDGGNQYALRTTVGWADAFLVDIGNLSVSDITFQNLTFSGPVSQTLLVERIVSADTAAASLDNVNFKHVRVEYIPSLFNTPLAATYPSWSDSCVDDVYMFGGNQMLTANVGFCVYTRCLIQRVYRQENLSTPVPARVDPQAGSSHNVYVEVTVDQPDLSTTDYDITSGSAIFRTVSQAARSVTLSGASPTLDFTGSAGIVDVTFGPTASGTVSVFATRTGETRVVRCVANTGSAVLESAANLVLDQDGQWYPNAGDTLTLICDSAGVWSEVGRSGRQNLSLAANAATLNTNNPTLSVGSQSMYQIDIGASSAGTLTLGDGTRGGQQLQLVVTSKAGVLSLPDSTANNVRLIGGVWPMANRSVLNLVWIAVDGHWWETGRAV